MRTERLFPEIASLVRLASYQHAEREAFVTFLPSGAQGKLSFSEVGGYSTAKLLALSYLCLGSFARGPCFGECQSAFFGAAGG